MDDDLIKQMRIKDIRQEEGAHELATSPDMRPYLELAKAVIRDDDATSALDVIGQLPLERRYVWRVASALKWGFADLDDMYVEVDRQTLGQADFSKLMDLLRLRPMQFCMFLKALVGVETMQRMMVQALAAAKNS